jgi:hypothetical protein
MERVGRVIGLRVNDWRGIEGSCRGLFRSSFISELSWKERGNVIRTDRAK